jgi:hypothetical protein
MGELPQIMPPITGMKIHCYQPNTAIALLELHRQIPSLARERQLLSRRLVLYVVLNAWSDNPNRHQSNGRNQCSPQHQNNPSKRQIMCHNPQ